METVQGRASGVGFVLFEMLRGWKRGSEGVAYVSSRLFSTSCLRVL